MTLLTQRKHTFNISTNRITMPKKLILLSIHFEFHFSILSNIILFNFYSDNHSTFSSMFLNNIYIKKHLHIIFHSVLDALSFKTYSFSITLFLMNVHSLFLLSKFFFLFLNVFFNHWLLFPLWFAASGALVGWSDFGFGEL